MRDARSIGRRRAGDATGVADARRARDARWATTLAVADDDRDGDGGRGADAGRRSRARARRWATRRRRGTGRRRRRDAGREEGAAGRGARGLPAGPCPLAPLAICERLNYVVIEEELRAKNAAEACARLPAGRRFLCAAARDAAATLSRAANWGDAAFAREARVVPLGGGKGRRASRAASYDHALASLCDLRMNKLCGSVVEQRFEHAAKHAELRNECEIAATLGEQWETSKEVCEAMQVDAKLAREAMAREVYRARSRVRQEVWRQAERNVDSKAQLQRGSKRQEEGAKGRR